MKYEVVQETSLNEGKKEIWYLVEPKNIIFKFFFNIIFLDYNSHKSKDDAILEAKLRSSKQFDKLISRKRIKG